MKLSKIISFSFIVLIFITIFSGCSDQKETVTLRYAAWNLGDISQKGQERQMIKAFMEKYPNIKIQIDENYVKKYDASLRQDAANSELPDVFMFAGNHDANSKNWCADLSKQIKKDSEWLNIPSPLREAASIKGKVIAVPSAIYFFGYFYNEDLVKKVGISLPETGLSIDDFKNALTKATSINDGRVGLADEISIMEWYPAAENSKYSWFSWDGGKFNLDSDEFKNGVKLAKSIFLNHETFAALTNDEKLKLKAQNDYEAWNSGKVGFKFDGTWAANDFSKLPFNVGFIGLPGNRPCIVPDFLFVSNKCPHPDEAYTFIKFMSGYSEEGFTKRLELAKDSNSVVSSLPMLKNQKILDEYFERTNIKGLRQVYSNLNIDSYVEGTKVLPGYTQARWTYMTNIPIGNTKNNLINDVLMNTFRGSLSIDEVSKVLNSDANQSVQVFPKPADN